MTKSQNTKNEQLKDLCITSEQLTEQWKKGELPVDKDYYIKLKCGLILIDYYCQLYDNCHFPNGIGFDSIPQNDIAEVLAPVPPYEVYKDLIDGRKLLREYIKDTTNENARLKERVSKLEKMQYSYTPEEWNTMLRTVNRTKELLKECKKMLMSSNYQNMTQYHEVLELRDKINKIIGEK